jgi:ADP-heptose:LPS heptosyltransferase
MTMPLNTSTPWLELIRTHAFGDVLMASAVLAGLKQQGYNTRFVVSEPFKALAEQHPLIDELIVLPWQKSNNFWRKRSLQRCLRQATQGFPKAERSVALTYPRNATLLRESLGGLGSLGAELLHLLAPKTHTVEVFCKQAGVPVSSLLTLPPLPPQVQEWAAPYNGAIVIQTRASQLKKQWPLPYWQALAKGLKKATGLRLLRIGALPNEPAIEGVEDIATPTMLHAVALQKNAALFIGLDSVFNHVSRALQQPALFLFGPTHPYRFGYGQNINLWAGRLVQPTFGDEVPEARQISARALTLLPKKTMVLPPLTSSLKGYSPLMLQTPVHMVQAYAMALLGA